MLFPFEKFRVNSYFTCLNSSHLKCSSFLKTFSLLEPDLILSSDSFQISTSTTISIFSTFTKLTFSLCLFSLESPLQLLIATGAFFQIIIITFSSLSVSLPLLSSNFIVSSLCTLPLSFSILAHVSPFSSFLLNFSYLLQFQIDFFTFIVVIFKICAFP